MLFITGAMYKVKIRSSKLQPYASSGEARGQLLLTLFSSSGGATVGPSRLFE
jgi:hypothetical protein